MSKKLPKLVLLQSGILLHLVDKHYEVVVSPGDIEDALEEARIDVEATAGKKRVTMMIDEDVLDILKQNDRYQTTANAVLRSYATTRKRRGK
ncbi:MAG: BrnA antitoxin family protein [Geminicoccaceae bacterium]